MYQLYVLIFHFSQGLAEKLFSRLRRSTEKFEVRLLMLDLITRLIGYHQLLVLPLYTFIQRYIASHQKDVTKVGSTSSRAVVIAFPQSFA